MVDCSAVCLSHFSGNLRRGRWQSFELLPMLKLEPQCFQRYIISPQGQRLIGRQRGDILDPSPALAAGFLSRAVIHEETVFHLKRMTKYLQSHLKKHMDGRQSACLSRLPLRRGIHVHASAEIQIVSHYELLACCG